MTSAWGARKLTVRRERSLPFPCQVLATRGRVVRADDVVARGERPRHPFALPVAAVLGEQERNVADLLLKRPGAEVAAGEVVAQKKGLFGRVVASCQCPEAGTVLEYRAADGLLVIRPKGETLSVAAGLTGKVVSQLEDRGVVIETPAVHCHGLALAGDEAWGTLRAAADDPAGSLAAGADCTGGLLFAGTADLESLRQTRAAGACGVVVGSVSAQVWEGLQTGDWSGFAVLVVESFGASPLGERTFVALGEAAGRPAFIGRGVALGQWPVRPELIVSLNTWSGLVQPTEPHLEVGAAVRVAAGPRAGRWGRVRALDLHLTEREYSMRATGAEVVLSDGSVLNIPTANLELLG